jgi:hypothetical protein
MKKISGHKSKIHGTGLFLEENVKKGSVVADIRGAISTVSKHLRHTPEEALMNPDWIGVSMFSWVDPEIPFKYINHSCDPSCGIKGKRRIYALKNLSAGDEVTIDYSTIEANPYWQMNCSCGSNKCRGIIRSVSYLPKALFKTYYPFLPTAFKKFYIKKNNVFINK